MSNSDCGVFSLAYRLFFKFWISCQHWKNQSLPTPHQKIRVSCFLEKLEDLETLGCMSTLQWSTGAEQQWPWTGMPLGPSPHPSLLPCFALPTRPISDSTEKWGFQKYLVVSSKPLALTCFPFYIPKCSPRLGGSEIVTDFLFVDSTLIHLVQHLAQFPQATCSFCPCVSTPEDLFIFHAAGSHKTKPEAPRLVGSHPYLSLLWFPLTASFRAHTGTDPQLCLLFPFLKSSLGLNHRIKLLFQLWACLSQALLVTLYLQNLQLNPAPALGNVSIEQCSLL